MKKVQFWSEFKLEGKEPPMEFLPYRCTTHPNDDRTGTYYIEEDVKLIVDALRHMVSAFPMAHQREDTEGYREEVEALDGAKAILREFDQTR